MGAIVLCGEHGRASGVLVCKHLEAAVVQRAALPPRANVLVELVDGIDVTLEWTYCTACIASASLPTPPAKLSEAALEALASELDPAPICEKCLLAAEQRT